MNPIVNDEQDRRVPVTFHPLVYPHPVTGRKALYALGHGAHGVRGWPEEEGLALIESLKTHVLQERFIYRHRYAVGDVVVWDTMATMHRATPIGIAGATPTRGCCGGSACAACRRCAAEPAGPARARRDGRSRA